MCPRIDSDVTDVIGTSGSGEVKETGSGRRRFGAVQRKIEWLALLALFLLVGSVWGKPPTPTLLVHSTKTDSVGVAAHGRAKKDIFLPIIGVLLSSAPNRPMAGIQSVKTNSATPAKAGMQIVNANLVTPTKTGNATSKILKFVMPGPHLLEYWNEGHSGDYIYYACKSEEQLATVKSVLPDGKIEFCKEAINALLAKEIPIICRKINEGDGHDLIEQGLLSITDINKLSKTRMLHQLRREIQGDGHDLIEQGLLSITDINKLSKTRMLHQLRRCVGESSDQWDIEVRTINGDEIKAFIDCRFDYSFGYLVEEKMGEFPDNTSLYAFVRNCISHIVAAKLDSTIDETNLKLKREISSSKCAKESGNTSGSIFFDSISFRVTCSRQIKPFLGDYFISRLSVLSRDTGEYVP
uniref:Uncharacterized protein n=1 Tax=Plectus sambesii TaxID=2011161 RepID=A0A914WGC1_9BILA